MCSSTAICWPWVPTRISTNAESTPRYDFWRATPSPEREFVRVDVERPSDVNALILSYVLATVKEAFAVAPGLTRVRIVALRSTRIDAYGKSGVEAISPFGLALRTHAPSPVLSQSWGWWPCARWRRRPVPLVLSACNVSPCRVDLLVLEQVNVVPEMWPDLPSGRVGIRLGKTST